MSGSTRAVLEIERLGADHIDGLMAMLRALESEGTDAWFRPHPFTAEHLHRISDPDEADLYVVVLRDRTVVGYGLLRGWGEGYSIPSLGVALHPDWRGAGLGAMLMGFLHCAARLRGSGSVRLRVSRDNERAIALYRRSGYVFQDSSADPSDVLLVGVRIFSR